MSRVLIVLALLVAGCQPASRYHSKPPTSKTSAAAELPPVPTFAEADADLIWQAANPYQLQPEVPLVFVHEGSNPALWYSLPDSWNPEWHRPLAALASPLAAAAMGGAGWLTPSIRIAVPLGLDDPTALVPAANPLTLGKWQLGKDLFFDDQAFLQAASESVRFSCAGCHQPEAGYTDPKLTMRLDTPTLINGVYRRHLFWDGRIDALERVVQRSLEDEKAPSQRRFLHSWPGVVRRLRADTGYVRRFRAVFGSEPTLDVVGKAIASYLRTILSGNSLQDRAEKNLRDRRGKTPTAGDYEKVIVDADLKALPWRHGPALTRSELATELSKGYTLFHGEAGCVQCHGGPTYSDGAFHNLGIGDSGLISAPGQETGRFAVVPPGEKSLHLIGAYQTPTLRDLPRTAPYFHSGSYLLGGRELDDLLFEVIVWHIKNGPGQRVILPQLDPAIQAHPLKEEEIRALVVFLKALAGQPTLVRQRP